MWQGQEGGGQGQRCLRCQTGFEKDFFVLFCVYFLVLICISYDIISKVVDQVVFHERVFSKGDLSTIS